MGCIDATWRQLQYDILRGTQYVDGLMSIVLFKIFSIQQYITINSTMFWGKEPVPGGPVPGDLA